MHGKLLILSYPQANKSSNKQQQNKKKLLRKKEQAIAQQ
jgi:hypothetical protein